MYYLLIIIKRVIDLLATGKRHVTYQYKYSGLLMDGYLEGNLEEQYNSDISITVLS